MHSLIGVDWLVISSHQSGVKHNKSNSFVAMCNTNLYNARFNVDKHRNTKISVERYSERCGAEDSVDG
jgi:hypothetical protein